MLSDYDLATWLEAANRRYSAEGISHKGRPFTAWREFSVENDLSLALDHPTTKAIFQWFYEHSPPGAHQIGAVYTGVYLYDTAFWPVCIPLTYGQVSVDAIECLETMPLQIKKMLNSSPQDLWSYVLHWADCMDYGYWQMDLEASDRLKPRALQFLGAGHAELKGANSQLLEARPNVKAILGMRMATEIFLKTVLVQELNLTDDELRTISHKLEKAAERCADVTGQSTFKEIAEQVACYPPVSARYEDTDWPESRVWQAAFVTQVTAATVTRLYSDRNIRAEVLRQGEPV
ncbi:hypothetical protein [Nitrosomonas ureae]|uniref:Uncharacterized protein n=1 Tax=Nitrosomonas ureae TaxID=44577 RepID=A0A286A3Z4_9PROT|nr:hypothetical protein [Nitrosomonas ureae]SOD16629.1 hypothetical protein SAMN06297164_0669 [Nitrosomonas ureae]